MFKWRIKKETGVIYQSWQDLPFNKYIELLEIEDNNERLKILTGCTNKQLEDLDFKHYLENKTIWSLTPYQSKIKNSIVFDNIPFVFPSEYNLLNQSYDQFAYVDQVLQPLYLLTEQLANENKKENKDISKITDITNKKTISIVKSYPNLIAAYINLGNNNKEFYSDQVGIDANKLNEYPCTDILDLGGFFLDCSIKLRSNNITSSQTLVLKVKNILKSMKKLATLISLKCGVLLWLLQDYAKRIIISLMRFGNWKRKK